MLGQVNSYLGGGNLETADLQHFPRVINGRDLHVLVDCHSSTGADPTIGEGFLCHFLIVAVAGTHRVSLGNQLSELVETDVRPVGTLDTGNDAWHISRIARDFYHFQCFQHFRVVLNARFSL